MTPSDFRGWRSAMALTQQEAADALGVSRMTITMYERGYRSDDQRPVVVPRSIELACAALWIGITGFAGNAVTLNDESSDEEPIRLLRNNEVPERFSAAAVRKLGRRGERVESHLSFPLKRFVSLWPEIEPWCHTNLPEGSYRFRPVPMIDAPGGGVAVMTFDSDTDATAFKIRWC